MNNSRLQILFALFIALLIGMNLLGGKIVSLFGVSVSVGIFMAPLTFLITDIIEEVYGKNIVKHFIIGGVISLVVIFLFTGLFVYLEPHTRYGFNEQYTTIFGSSLRMIIASIVAFLLAQIHDVIAFEWWKKKTKGKALWLRNNLSTIISQLIDTFVFMMIAFYHITPKFTFAFIISLAIPYYLFKILFAIIDTPFVYMGVKWLKNEKESVEIAEGQK
ncbi:MAG: queuosine precursor transporter [Candidatus Magasanikbacteria bacterium]|jgi:queuosine precursor transporter|nr:queuosine precursor transporter [Candidatus Magasanikbacteria bacterium]MBT4071496.1 queuosine precursor transporter [Candidatus Magasanikbacteria bacterium]